MVTTTAHEQLAEIRRRVDMLQRSADAAEAGASQRIQQHVDVLRKQEASIRSALRAVPDRAEAKLLAQLTARLEVAEQAALADACRDRPSFEQAVDAELRSWDTYIERLQLNGVAKAAKTREEAEAAIGDLRRRRITAGDSLARVREASGDNWQEHRQQLDAAREGLENKADELSATLS